MFMVDSAPLVVVWSMMTVLGGCPQCAHKRRGFFMRLSKAAGLVGFIFCSRIFRQPGFVGQRAAWNSQPLMSCV